VLCNIGQSRRDAPLVTSQCWRVHTFHSTYCSALRHRHTIDSS